MFRNNITKITLQAGYKFVQREISTSDLRLQLDIPSNAYTMGTCGTTKWEVKDKLDELKKVEKINLPGHLIRPPCLPGGTLGEYQTCMVEGNEGGMYCIPCKEKYKYPPFSENIDFVPPRDSTCWWKAAGPMCQDHDQSALGDITRPCYQDIEL